MQISKNLTHIILTSIVMILIQSIVGTAGAIQASYQDLQTDVFMKSWLLLGPIPFSPRNFDPQSWELHKKAFDTDFLAQHRGESGIVPQLDIVEQIDGKEYKWQLYESKDETVDLNKAYGNLEFVIAYALAEIDMSEEKDVLLGIGSDDAVKVWLNGKLIHENWTLRGVNKDEDIFQAKFQKGRNQILFKVQNMTQGWGFCCHMPGRTILNEKLISAAGDGDLGNTTMLLSHGADVNATIEPGLTALHKATIAGRKDAVDLLLKNGADPNIKLPDKEKLANAVFNRIFKGNSPGAAVLVAKDGKTIYQKGFGYADIGDHIPFTVDTKSRIGSMTKIFTASAILKLQEEGKLNVNDRLSKFIPDFPRGDEVTIHHLLTHTSGIHDYTYDPDFYKTVASEAKPEEIIDSIKKGKFDFNPGDKWQYDNSGYFLLGHIVEKVSGQSLDEYLKSTFFEPLGMKNTGIHTSKLILENEAIGYSYDNGKSQKALNWDMSRVLGAGALYSTVSDLYLWNEGIFNGTVLSKSSFDSAFTPVTLNNGKEFSGVYGGYGYGWMIEEYRGLRLMAHGGGLDGFNGDLRRYPDINATVVVLQNFRPFTPGISAVDFNNQISEIFFWEQMKLQESSKQIK